MTEAELPLVLHAIHALYGLEGADRQRDANGFLIEFARSEAAWRVGMQLLCDASLETTTETLYFAANMIHSKARKEWFKLADADKSSMVAMLQTLLQESQRGQRPAMQGAPLQHKLCGILAIALCAAPDECRAMLDTLMAQAQAPSADATALAFFVTMARCVCEEMEHAELSFTAKDAMELHVATVSSEVVRVLSEIVLSPQSAVQGDALLCLGVWMKRAGTSLTRLYASHPRLLLALIETLGQRSTHLSASAEILCQVFKVSEYPTASLQEQALEATARGLLALRAAYEGAVASDEEESAHSITDVVATFCETYTDWILAGEAPEAVALGDMMLHLGLHTKRQIASLTLEFWLLVQEEPVAERHAFFQRDAFVRLLSVLLQQCEYPAAPADMDEFELDDLVAYRSGSQGVADVLVATFALLKEQFLSQLLAQVASSQASWAGVEVCLFAVSTIADDLKKRLLSNVLRSDALEAMTQQLMQLLLVQTSPSQQHPLVVMIGSKLLGQFGSWFNDRAVNTASAEDVTTVLQYLDQAMVVEGCRPPAAKSFMQIATSCSPCLVDMPPSFLVSAVQHFSNRTLQIQDRLMVVEGLVRVAAQSSHSSDILQRLLDDALGRLDTVLSVSDVAVDVLEQVVCNELQVCSKIVRFLDAPHDVAGGKALTKWVVATIWVHVEPIANRVGASESAMNALFEFYGWCLQSLRDDMAPQLPVIANLIVRIFEEQLFVAPLECGSIAVDVFGRGADQHPAVLDSFRGLMGVLSRIAFQVFTARGVDEAPDVLRALFELAYRFLLYCPAAVITASEFPVLLDLCRACVGNQDRGSTNAMLTFLSYLLQESRGKLSHFQPIIDQVVWADATRLESWVDALLLALATTTPSVLYESVSRLFMALWIPAFDQYGAAVATITTQSLLTKAEVLGVHELSVDDRQRVTQRWFCYAQTPTRMAERKFRSLCADFAKICRKELTADALLSYEDDAT